MKHLRSFVALTMAAAVLSSCFNRLTYEEFEEKKAKEEDYFSFITSSDVRLCLDYGEIGARALVQLYDQDPLILQDDKSVLNKDLIPVHQQFTDSAGRIDAEITLPGHISEGVWVYSGFMGLPMCEYCQIENGVISNYSPNGEEDTKAAGTKALASTFVRYQLNGNIFTLVKWSNKYGKPNDENGLFSDGSLTSSDLTAIKAAVWNGQSSKPDKIDNIKYTTKGTYWTNTNVREYYRDASGVVHTITSAQLYFTFVQESGWNENVVGYYFYPTDKVPSSPDGLKKYIILPNASIAGNAPYGAKGYDKNDWGQANAPISINKKIQLLYEDENGNMTPNFPPNTTVGYFVIPNAWKTTGNTPFSKFSPTSFGTKATEVDEPVTVNVGGTYRAELSKTYDNLEWTSSQPGIATVSGERQNGVDFGTITGITEGKSIVKAIRHYKVLFIAKTETVGRWEVTVQKTGSGPGGVTIQGSINFSQPIFYSNGEWNQRNRVMTRNTGKYMIYGFEDNDDDSKSEKNYTFEDIVFTISSDPQQAVIDPNNPDTIPESEITEQKLKIGQRDFLTYCYEDLWPYMGDYDMNDVVVEHRAGMYFDNDNSLLEVRDTFTVSNEIASSGEGVKDAFAIRIPTSQRSANMSLPEGAIIESDTESIILFKNAQDNLKKSFIIRRAFDKGTISMSSLVRGLDLDPYIIPVFPDETIQCTDNNRREVHFPKKPGTSKVNPQYYINDTEAFYVARDNKHPFAIAIPLPVARTREEIAKAKIDGSMFILPSEMYSIDGQYAKSGHSFEEWVSSNGSGKTDWYKNYKVRDNTQVERVEMNTYK